MNNEKIKIAIIMPAYNCEDTIKKSILSVINQTYTNWHLYIINDCSVDNTSIILEDYFLNDKITIIENEENIGAAGSRNRGITLSTEPVIAFIDSDDLWNENKLLLQVEEIAKGEKFIITDYDYIE
ncbi:TPA: glycosyltransferase, partial [Klebsiella pneumoniae]|nr:glycosyltransferase [Klebsiella pneumoniae]